MAKLEEVECSATDEWQPRATLERKLREHQERAQFLTFLRDHISAAEVYRLDAMDLRMVDILPEKPW